VGEGIGSAGVNVQAIELDNLAQQLVATCYLKGDFVLASGRRSSYYFDKYRFETRPELLAPVASLIAARIRPGVDRLAGPELGAVAIATAVSLQAGLPFIIVRSEAKDYGTGQRIEGPFRPGDSVALLEDVLTTGGSVIKAAQAVAEAGCRVVQVIGVVDREEGAQDAVRAAGYELDAIFTRSQLERWMD
jgi:orotate phosphoribosyltransferase